LGVEDHLVERCVNERLGIAEPNATGCPSLVDTIAIERDRLDQVADPVE
jgi:hypothetical protein